MTDKFPILNDPPQPDIPVDEAWSKMDQLLNNDPVLRIVPKRYYGYSRGTIYLAITAIAVSSLLVLALALMKHSGTAEDTSMTPTVPYTVSYPHRLPEIKLSSCNPAAKRSVIHLITKQEENTGSEKQQNGTVVQKVTIAAPSVTIALTDKGEEQILVSADTAVAQNVLSDLHEKADTASNKTLALFATKIPDENSQHNAHDTKVNHGNKARFLTHFHVGLEWQFSLPLVGGTEYYWYAANGKKQPYKRLIPSIRLSTMLDKQWELSLYCNPFAESEGSSASYILAKDTLKIQRYRLAKLKSVDMGLFAGYLFAEKWQLRLGIEGGKVSRAFIVRETYSGTNGVMQTKELLPVERGDSLMSMLRAWKADVAASIGYRTARYEAGLQFRMPLTKVSPVLPTQPFSGNVYFILKLK